MYGTLIRRILLYLLSVFVRTNVLDEALTEFLQSFPSPPSSVPVGISQPKDDEISLAFTDNHSSMEDDNSIVEANSNNDMWDKAQKTALEKDIGSIEGSILIRTSNHNIGIQAHSVHSKEVSLFWVLNSLQQLSSFSSTSWENSCSSSSTTKTWRVLDWQVEVLFFSFKETKAEASETIMVLIRSNAGWRKEECRDESINELTKEGPLPNKRYGGLANSDHTKIMQKRKKWWDEHKNVFLKIEKELNKPNQNKQTYK